MSRDRANKRFYRVDSSHELRAFLDRGQAANQENRWTFEVAWEAANKVGGIYTVIRSKAYISVEEMGEQYCLLGPYKEYTARTEVEEADFPENNPLSVAVNAMRSQGYKLHTGTWLVDGNPQVVLFDIGSGAWTSISSISGALATSASLIWTSTLSSWATWSPSLFKRQRGWIATMLPPGIPLGLPLHSYIVPCTHVDYSDFGCGRFLVID